MADRARFTWSTSGRSRGRYQLQLRYRNGANQINLGISSGVKRLTVTRCSGAIVASGVVVLPHTRLDNATRRLIRRRWRPACSRAATSCSWTIFTI